MCVVKQAVSHVSPNHTQVIALDQLLYAITKQIQWKIMMGDLHIEMVALKIARYLFLL